MRRWVIRLCLLAVVAALLPTAYAVWVRDRTLQANRRALAAAEATLDRSDPGWRAADLLAAHNARVPPVDQNLIGLCTEVYAVRPKPDDRWTDARDDWPKPPDLNRLPPPAAVTASRKLRDDFAEAVRLARTVRTRPTGRAPLVLAANPYSTLLPHLDGVRPVAAILDLDGSVAAFDGDWPRAAAAVADGLHLCRALDGEPFLISQLVRHAVAAIAVQSLERVVGWGEPPAGLLADLPAALLAEAVADRLTPAFRGERASLDRLFRNLDDGTLTLRQLSGGGADPLDGLGWYRYRVHLPGDHAFTLDYHTRLVGIVGRPSHEQIDLFGNVELPPPAPDRIFSRTMLPAFDKVTAAEWRTVARLRCAAAGVACERFRQAHGRWPIDLCELAELLPTVPLDPYDGQPLRFRRLADGVVVYSVGPDRRDDGGTLSYGQPQAGEDVGFRLWDVPARRLPPPEDAP